jgi:hypothetical protein
LIDLVKKVRTVNAFIIVINGEAPRFDDQLKEMIRV